MAAFMPERLGTRRIMLEITVSTKSNSNRDKIEKPETEKYKKGRLYK